ncbi:hypothetical protein SAMN04488505_105324 [Chitinophaga rupis]|uniref:Uncharacterized protein n=1 Tax=Chitinophaga rupis TaxID=573321 RepID=A0A1H8A7J0_9BACT|nr:hypothetical protein SAMN04488505_105324 [Chitinophaga rupis]
MIHDIVGVITPKKKGDLHKKQPEKKNYLFIIHSSLLIRSVLRLSGGPTSPAVLLLF